MHESPSPDNTDAGTEAELQLKGLTAPRVTQADVEAAIASEHYFTGRDGACGAGADESSDSECPLVLSNLTFCVLVLKDGFTVTGESACTSPEKFDADIGCRLAREKAIGKVRGLLGFRLRNR